MSNKKEREATKGQLTKLAGQANNAIPAMDLAFKDWEAQQKKNNDAGMAKAVSVIKAKAQVLETTHKSLIDLTKKWQAVKNHDADDKKLLKELIDAANDVTKGVAEGKTYLSKAK